MKRIVKVLGIATLIASFSTGASAQEPQNGNENAGFFKQAFRDMKESAKRQREIDRANFKAQKMETRAFYEEQKALSSPKNFRAMQESEYEHKIAEAKSRQEAAERRIDDARRGSK